MPPGPTTGPAFSRQNRAERLIAAARVALAGSSLVAVCLDPTEPAKYARTIYGLLAVYFVYASLLAVLAWRSPVPLRRLGLATHASDLWIFLIFMYFTEGPTSPFFAYFVFSLLCATLRWQWRGTLWTGLMALALYIGLGVYAGKVLRAPGLELNDFIIRSVYLGVVAILLGCLGTYQERAQRDMARLAAWSHPVAQEARAFVQNTLEQAARILDAPRVAMAWGEPEEPGLHLAWWSSHEFEWIQTRPATAQPLVADLLGDTSFICLDPQTPAPEVLYASSPGFERWRGAPLNPELQARFAPRTLLSVKVQGTVVGGRLFWLTRRGVEKGGRAGDPDAAPARPHRRCHRLSRDRRGAPAPTTRGRDPRDPRRIGRALRPWTS